MDTSTETRLQTEYHKKYCNLQAATSFVVNESENRVNLVEYGALMLVTTRPAIGESGVAF